MSSIIQDAVEPVAKDEYKTVASVRFRGTQQGELDESELDADGHTLSDHYLYGSGDTKGDFSYPVVDADGYLRRYNVEAAYNLGARGGIDEDEHENNLESLNDEFDNPPIDFGEDEESARLKQAAQEAGVDSDGEVFERAVAFKAADADEQIAIGAALTPNEVDHQGDFFSEDTIRHLAENFEERVEERDAVPGVMHTVFPSDHIELVDSRILEGRMELGDRELPKGTWVQAWRFSDDTLWSLIEDGVLGGYSIGGTVSDDWVRYDPEDHPDKITFPEEVTQALNDAGLSPEEVSVREITGGRILETSAVDFPAVPSATHEAYKSRDLSKADAALTGSIVEARLYLEERGHSEEDARRLANYLNREKSKKSSNWVQRAKDFFTPGSDSVDSREADAVKAASAAEHRREDATAKAGRTLSEQNITSTMAIVDAGLDMLSRSDVDHGRMRFSDDPTVDFDAGDYGAGKESGDQTTGADTSTGDRHADAVFESMSDTQVTDLSKSIDQLTDATAELNERLDDEGDGTDNETKSESTEDGDDLGEKVADLEEKFDTFIEQNATDDETDDVAELRAEVSDLREDISTLAETQQKSVAVMEQMADAQGVSQQADIGKSEQETTAASTKAQFFGTDKLTGGN